MEVSMRIRTASENVKMKTNTVTENLVTGSLNTMAMIRGESWVLASCTAINRAEETKMMKVNIEEANVPNTTLVVSRLSVDSQPNVSSIRCRSGTAMSAVNMPSKGSIHIELTM